MFPGKLDTAPGVWFLLFVLILITPWDRADQSPGQGVCLPAFQNPPYHTWLLSLLTLMCYPPRPGSPVAQSTHCWSVPTAHLWCPQSHRIDTQYKKTFHAHSENCMLVRDNPICSAFACLPPLWESQKYVNIPQSLKSVWLMVAKNILKRGLCMSFFIRMLREEVKNSDFCLDFVGPCSHHSVLYKTRCTHASLNQKQNKVCICVFLLSLEE